MSIDSFYVVEFQMDFNTNAPVNLIASASHIDATYGGVMTCLLQINRAAVY